MHNKNFITTAAVLIIVSAFVLPVPSGLANLLLIFGLCLAGATFFVCRKAEDISEVPGLGVMIATGAGLSAGVLVIFMKLAFFGADSGKIPVFAVGLLTGGTGLILPVAVIVVTVIVVLSAMKAGYSCGQANILFKNEIAPLRRSSIHHREYAGLTDSQQVRKEEQKLSKQREFFEGMSSAGMFVLFAEIFNVLVLVPGLVLVSLGMEQAAMRKGAGIAGILQIPVLLYAMGCNHIIRKSFYSLSPEAQENREGHKNRIKVFSRDVTEGFYRSKPPGSIVNTLTKTKPAGANEEIVDADWVSPEESRGADFSLLLRDTRRIQKGKHYDELAKEVAGKTEQIIVMAGANPADLPVTIPVNVAMRLAKSGKKVLLCDMDETRNAVARVFDITHGGKRQIRESCVRGLWVGQQADTSKTDGFDFVIIYAPTEPAIRKITDNRSLSVSSGFMIYSSNKNKDADCRICEMIKDSDGKLY